MRYKKLIFSVIALFAFTVTQAQFLFSASAGVNFSNISRKVNGKEDESFKYSNGFIIQADVYYTIKKNLQLQSGINIEQVTTKLNVSTSSTNFGNTVNESITGKSNITYIQVPVKLVCQIPVANNTIMLAGGPFIGFAIGGKYSSNAYTETINNLGTFRDTSISSGKYSFGKNADQIKGINAGVGFSAGIKLHNNLLFTVYSNIGLANLSNQNNNANKTMAFGITAGYMFPKKIFSSKKSK